MPSGFSSVTIYSFKFILNAAESDNAKTLEKIFFRVDNRFSGELLTAELPLLKHKSLPRKEELITVTCICSCFFSAADEKLLEKDDGRGPGFLQLGNCSEHI